MLPHWKADRENTQPTCTAANVMPLDLFPKQPPQHVTAVAAIVHLMCIRMYPSKYNVSSASFSCPPKIQTTEQNVSIWMTRMGALVGVNSCANSDLVATQEDREKKRFSENCPNSGLETYRLFLLLFVRRSLGPWVLWSILRSPHNPACRTHIVSFWCRWEEIGSPGLCLPVGMEKNKDAEWTSCSSCTVPKKNASTVPAFLPSPAPLWDLSWVSGFLPMMGSHKKTALSFVVPLSKKKKGLKWVNGNSAFQLEHHVSWPCLSQTLSSIGYLFENYLLSHKDPCSCKWPNFGVPGDAVSANLK